MTTACPRQFALDLRHEVNVLRGNWLWFIILGAALVIVGFAALSAVEVASLATALFLGMLLVVGGIFETFGAFWCRGWSGFFVLLLGGVFSVIVGVLFLRAPVGALLTLTLLLSCLLMVGGIFRIVAALSYHFAAWGWALFSGIVDLTLGVMIWRQWPASALWVQAMEQKKLLSTLAALTVTCTMGAACAAQQQGAAPPQGQGQSALPAAISVETVSCTATVQAIDDAKRIVTLKDSDGATIMYKVGKDVINFDQIKVGDQIEAKLVRQLALFVRKPDAPAVDGEAAGVALAPKGAMPGGIVIDTVQVTDKIEAIDSQKRLVTLIGEDGQSLTVHLGPKVNLAELRKGDLVVARLTDGLILAVQKAPEPQLAEAKLTGAAVVSTMRCTATVKAIDYDKRTITLRESDGATDTYKAGNSVANFDQIKARDQIQATLVESLAIYLRKAGAPAGEEETGAVALAPKGALPGVIMADTVQASAKVEAIDQQKRVVTLQDANGNSHTIHVGPRVDLAAFQKGDDVVARYTQDLAILVEK